MNPLEGIQISDDWLNRQSLQSLFELLCSQGGQAMVAGGAVRNALMGKAVADIDLATTVFPEEVIQRVETAGHKVIPTGIDHGTVTAVIDGTAFEITTLRQDIETDGRHAVVSFGSDWEADASRRDFTMNGLYCDRNGRVFDLVGGYNDIQSGVVRFIGEAETRIEEDALRILRFFRFFAWYGDGRPDAAGLKACSSKRSLLDNLSAERVWMELKRLLSSTDPSRALLWMRTTGILSAILPESEKWGIDAIPGLMRIESREDWMADPLLRLCAMVRPDVEVVSQLSKRLQLSNAERDRLVEWAQTNAPDPDTAITDLKRIIYRSSQQGLLDKMCIEAVRLLDTDNETAADAMIKLIAFTKEWKRPIFPVKGQDLLDVGMEPGERIGQALSELEEKWILSDFKLDKQELLSKI